MGGKARSGGLRGMAQAVKRNVTFPPMSPRACGGPVVGPQARRGRFLLPVGPLRGFLREKGRFTGVRACCAVPVVGLRGTQGALRFPPLRLCRWGFTGTGALLLFRAGLRACCRGRGASEGAFRGKRAFRQGATDLKCRAHPGRS